MDKRKLFICIFFVILFLCHPIVCFLIGIFYLIIYSNIKKFSQDNEIDSTENNMTETTDGVILKCAKCDSLITVNHKFCTNCGTAIEGDNVKVEPNLNTTPITVLKNYVKASDFDPIFSLPEDEMVNKFLSKELVKASIKEQKKVIPSDVLKRKNIFNIIFSVLLFIYISLIFFHFPLATYIIGLILLIIFFILTRRYNLMKYLKKQIKARPSEKITNIVMSTKQNLVTDTSSKFLLLGGIFAIVLPLIIFIKPVILYEKMDNGYGVRYYAYGLTNFKTATIPEKHNGEYVVSLRGNTFSNMPYLEEVNLPDSIIEIRGQAFKNNKRLKNIKLPSSLEYLGGGAFYNCVSLESIVIPDSVTYIGGEAFYNAESLREVVLPNNLTEIRGSTFEYCDSLKSIEIPDSVTRIGGHAFYANYSLASVVIGENSKLNEIGSSAFRLCSSLYEITIPQGVYVNGRAFKESPTTVKQYGIDSNYNYNNYYYGY